MKTLFLIYCVLSSLTAFGLEIYKIEVVDQRTREIKNYHKNIGKPLYLPPIGLKDCVLNVESPLLCSITCYDLVNAYGTTGTGDSVMSLRLFEGNVHSHTIIAICRE